MNDFRDENESIEQIEAMVRAAGGYVQVSENLRPSVVESARIEQGERRARRCIGQVAGALLVLAYGLGAIGDRLGASPIGMSTSRALSAVDAVFALAQFKEAHERVDFGWGIVEVFSEERSRQAQSLNSSSTPPK